MTKISLEAQPEKVVKYVSIQAAAYLPTGKLALSDVVAGDVTAAETQKQRVLLLDGEQDPLKAFDWMQVKTFSSAGNWANQCYQPYKTLITAYPGLAGSTFITVPTGTRIITFGDDFSQTPPDWLVKQLGLKEVFIDGWISSSLQGHYANDPLLYEKEKAFSVFNGFYNLNQTRTGSAPYTYSGQHSFKHNNVKAWLIPTANIPLGSAANWETGSTVVKTEELSFVFPPSDLATNLWSSQNWLPFSGSIEFAPINQQPIKAGDTVSIAGALPAWDNAKMLVTNVSHDLTRGTKIISVGIPPRIDAASLLDRARRNAG